MLWQELARIALLGTERTTFSEEVETHLQTLGISEELSPAQQLLEAAAFQTQLQKVAPPKHYTSEALPAPIDATKEQYLSTKSVGHIQVILEKNLIPLLPEFTRTMEEVDQFFPPESLPSLLDASVTNFELWACVATRIGERGWWLLRQHPEWKHLAQQSYARPSISIKKVRASMTFVQKLRQSLSSNPLLINQEHRQQLQEAAFYADLNQYDALRDGWFLNYQFNHNWTRDVEQFLRILAFRKAMVAELIK